jgi:hypothetical protein
VVASSLTTVSARAMLNALIAGERDPAVLAELARGKMRAKIPALPSGACWVPVPIAPWTRRYGRKRGAHPVA